MIKNIFKSDFFKMMTALSAVAVFSGVSLVLIYQMTAAGIVANRNKESVQAVLKLFPDADVDRLMEQVKHGMGAIVPVAGKDGKALGYAFKASGNGYQGPIEVIGGLNADLTQMQGIEIVDSQETPGLGAEIAGEKFKKQFLGLAVTQPIEYVKGESPDEPHEVESITGATISSRAVVSMLNERIEEIRNEIKEKK